MFCSQLLTQFIFTFNYFTVSSFALNSTKLILFTDLEQYKVLLLNYYCYDINFFLIVLVNRMLFYLVKLNFD